MERAMDIPTAPDRALVHRLLSVRGHLDAVIRMVDDGGSCLEVLHQLPAMQGALAAVRRELMERHLRTCVAEAIAAGHPEALVEELLGALQAPRVGRDRRLRAATTTTRGGR